MAKPDNEAIEAHQARAKARSMLFERERRRAAGPTKLELLDEMARCCAMTPARHRTPAEEIIRAVRDGE